MSAKKKYYHQTHRMAPTITEQSVDQVEIKHLFHS